MKNRKNFIILVVLALSGLLFMAGCRHNDPEKMAEHAIGELTSRLNLSESQKQQLEAIKQEILTKVSASKADREAAQELVMSQLEAGELDSSVLKDTVSKRFDQAEETADLFIDRFVQFYASLSPEQKSKFYEFIKEKHEAHEKIFSELMSHR